MKRYKHKHLTFDQKMYVYKRIKEGEEISHISNRIGIALSTAKKIIRTIQAYPSKNKIFTSIRCKKRIYQQAVKNWIADNVRAQKNWFNTSDFQDFIKNKLLVHIPISQITENLKSRHRLSFKKGTSRLVELDTIKIKLLKILYCWKKTKQIENIKLLITMINQQLTKIQISLISGSKEESRGVFEISSLIVNKSHYGYMKWWDRDSPFEIYEDQQ